MWELSPSEDETRPRRISTVAVDDRRVLTAYTSVATITMLATGDAGSSIAYNSGEQTSGGTVGTYKGRKFVPTKGSKATAAAAAAAAKMKMKIPKNVNLEDLHQAMEEDSTAVDVLKREVRTARKKKRAP